jgi:hypothetical protein
LEWEAKMNWSSIRMPNSSRSVRRVFAWMAASWR